MSVGASVKGVSTVTTTGRSWRILTGFCFGCLLAWLVDPVEIKKATLKC